MTGPPELVVLQAGVGGRIAIEHHGWERLGPVASQWRDRHRAGWQTLLPHFAAAIAKGEQLMATGTKDDPWELTTPPGTSRYTMYQGEQASPPTLVCQAGSTTLKYHLSAIEDLHGWRGAGPLATPSGLVRAAQRLPRPVRHVPAAPAEALGLAELTHDPRNNRMRAI